MILEELDERDYGYSRFWKEPNVAGQRLGSSLNKALTVLKSAARVSNLEILDMLRAAGAEDSTRRLVRPEFQVEDADWPTFFLSISSPVH